MGKIDKKIIERGLKGAESKIFQEDKIWSRYSNDKVNIGETLAKVLRTLNKAFALSKKLTALSIGSSNEPQFRILESGFRGGLYLLDIEKDALNIVKERIQRQHTDHVETILGDYDRIFLNTANAVAFRKHKLHNERMNLITLHHSMYYCNEDYWNLLFGNLYRQILAPMGAIHAVLMAAHSSEPYTTSWLYDYFVGKFFGGRNKQDLYKFKNELQKDNLYGKAQILFKKSRINFFVNDFEMFMAVIWMVLLYPNVHPYSLKQREEITEFIYNKFWRKARPLVQIQEHLVIYRGINLKGLI
jgi:hypothetical protein